MTVGDLIQRLGAFRPEFPVFCRLTENDHRVVAPVDVRMDLTDPTALLGIDEYDEVPPEYVDSVVLFPCEIPDED